MYMYMYMLCCHVSCAVVPIPLRLALPSRGVMCHGIQIQIVAIGVHRLEPFFAGIAFERAAERASAACSARLLARG